jgi:multicomponent Na+:H+ antiporter subunit E
MTSGWSVALQVLKGSKGDKGGLLDYQTRITKPWQMILLFNMLSMTPGSLSTDIDEKIKIIKVHLLNMDEKQQFYKVTSKIEALLMKAI